MLFFLAIVLAAQTPAPTLPQQGTISGRLLGTDGAPAANVRVIAMDVDGSEQENSLATVARTDSEGRYLLDGLLPGRYLISAGALSGTTYFPGTAVRKEATTVTLSKGQAIKGADFSLLVIPPSRVSGRITLPDGQSPSDHWIGLISTELLGKPMLAIAATFETVGSDGSFELTKAPAGNYFLVLSGQMRPLFPTAGGDPVITVEGRDVTGLDMVSSEPVTVIQSIRVEDGSPIPGFDLLLTDLQNLAPPVTRSGISNLAAPLYSGDYRVSLTCLPPSYVVRSMTSGGIDLTKQPLRVRPGQAPREFSIVLGATPTLKPQNGGELKAARSRLDCNDADGALRILESVTEGADSPFLADFENLARQALFERALKQFDAAADRQSLTAAGRQLESIAAGGQDFIAVVARLARGAVAWKQENPDDARRWIREGMEAWLKQQQSAPPPAKGSLNDDVASIYDVLAHRDGRASLAKMDSADGSAPHPYILVPSTVAASLAKSNDEDLRVIIARAPAGLPNVLFVTPEQAGFLNEWLDRFAGGARSHYRPPGARNRPPDQFLDLVSEFFHVWSGSTIATLLHTTVLSIQFEDEARTKAKVDTSNGSWLDAFALKKRGGAWSVEKRTSHLNLSQF